MIDICIISIVDIRVKLADANQYKGMSNGSVYPTSVRVVHVGHLREHGVVNRPLLREESNGLQQGIHKAIYEAT